MRQFQFLGTTDEHTSCDCCGKKDLKSTVAIRNLETGEDLFFGVTCAARALNLQVAEVRKGTSTADKAARVAKQSAERDAAIAAYRAARAAREAKIGEMLRRERAEYAERRRNGKCF
jgi:hypothetical protein